MSRSAFAILASLAVAAWPAPSAAAPKCDAAARAATSGVAAGTAVRLAGEPAVAAGQSFVLNWRRGDLAGRHPIYLMIAFDAPVRFAGKGFYALLPQASAAFGIQHFAGKTRAVIPLYGLGVPARGEVTVQPLLAGPLNVQWALVGHDRCKEYVAESGRGAAQIGVVSTGAPEIVVSDVLAGERPKQRIFSPAGGRVIEVYDRRYRLVDEESRAELAERAGHTPRFSPTGRFLAAYSENGVEILDTADGKIVYRDALGQELAWDNGDSFAILGQGGWGSVALLMPSRAAAVLVANPDGGYACHACGATESVALRIDLENNVAVIKSSAGGDARVVGLTTKAENWIAKLDANAFVARQSQVAPFAIPKRWELRGGLKFSHLGAGQNEMASGSDRFQNALRKFLIRPLTAPAGPSNQDASNNAVQVAQWRSVSITDKSAHRNMLKRLQEFGLPIPDAGENQSSVRFAREAILLGGNQGGEVSPPGLLSRMKAIARRIESELPSTRGVFVPKGQDGGACYPFSEKPDDQVSKVYDEVQRAFRFQRGNRIVWIAHLQCQEGSATFQYPSLVLFDSVVPHAWFLDRDTGDPDTNVGTMCFPNIAFCDFDAHIFGNRFLLLSSANSRAIEIFDLDQRRSVFKKYNLPRGDLLVSALLSSDANLVLQINSDGSFAGFRFSDAKQLFEGRYVDDEIVIWTPDGRFDATAEGAHYVSLRLPGRTANYTFEQFSARLKTPGLVTKLLAGQTFEAPKLVSPPSLKGTMQVRDGRIHGTAEARADAALASLLVFQDGLLSRRLDAPRNGAAWDFELDMLPGTRWISMVAMDRNGLASLPMGRALAASQTSPRRVHVLSIGIDDYADPRIPDLNLARSDARRFAEAVGAIGRDVVVASTRILHEKDATRDGVLTALRQVISGAAPGKTVLLFFAGHGVRSDDGAYFLATPDTRIDDINASALPWNDVAEILMKSRARIAVFLDTCHSGAAGTGAFSTNDAAAQSLLERIPSGIVVFSASKGRELSEETEAVGGGVFTSALVKVIAGERGRFDSNRNGAIEMSELYSGVKAQVTAITDGRQTPWIARNQMIGDFALF